MSKKFEPGVIESMKSKYEAGMPVSQLAKEIGISQDLTKKTLLANGIVIRSKGIKKKNKPVETGTEKSEEKLNQKETAPKIEEDETEPIPEIHTDHKRVPAKEDLI